METSQLPLINTSLPYLKIIHNLSKFSVIESVPSFHHVDPGDGTHIVRLGNRLLYVLTHLAGPNFPF